MIGSALTLPGSVSNVTLLDDFHLDHDRQLQRHQPGERPELIQFTAPTPAIPTPVELQDADDGDLSRSRRPHRSQYLSRVRSSPSDRLIIDGGSASGASRSHRQHDGSGRSHARQRHPRRRYDQRRRTVPATFSLAAPVIAGPYEYGLFEAAWTPAIPKLGICGRRSTACGIQPIRCASQTPSSPSPAPGPAPAPIPHYRRRNRTSVRPSRR